jgi:feruloyl esterase
MKMSWLNFLSSARIQPLNISGFTPESSSARPHKFIKHCIQIAILCLICLAAGQARAATSCEALAGGGFNLVPGAPTEVISAAMVPALDQMPAYCAVAGYVNPDDNFGLWMPEPAHWNGKYMVRGCGGSCGSVVEKLACHALVRDGYACLITDMGHTSTLLDNVWVADNLQGQLDFGYRSTHVTTVAGRAILTAFYGRGPAESYFMGCSTGGRQAMIEAERFPLDFNGIIAMAPASMAPFSGGLSSVPSIDDLNRGTNGRAILTNRKLPMLHRAVLAACGGQDGTIDGLVADPAACNFSPASLLCKGLDNQDCLTAPQVAAAIRIYKERGQALGSELAWIDTYLHDSDPMPPADPYTSRGDPATEESLINPADPDLHPFKAHGGKLIMVQGWADPSVMPEPTINYYRLATATMGGQAEMERFARLFMVPGMQHCSGGEGAYAIDYVGALNNWVEHGKAPHRLVGAHPRPGVHLDFFSLDLKYLKPSDFAFTRPYFPYPLIAVYSGHGNPDDESSFIAVQPGTKLPSAHLVVSPGAEPPPVQQTPDGRAKALRDAMDQAEQWATSSGFPPSYVVTNIEAAMLINIDADKLSGDDERALLNQVAGEHLSAAEKAALPTVRAQLQRDT